MLYTVYNVNFRSKIIGLVRLELTRLSTPEPKSGGSANSPTIRDGTLAD